MRDRGRSLEPAWPSRMPVPLTAGADSECASEYAPMESGRLLPSIVALRWVVNGELTVGKVTDPLAQRTPVFASASYAGKSECSAHLTVMTIELPFPPSVVPYEVTWFVMTPH